jgi:hypothetical protein
MADHFQRLNAKRARRRNEVYRKTIKQWQNQGLKKFETVTKYLL